MAQRVLGGTDISGEDPNAVEEQSTFDRLLREYFAILVGSELPAATGEGRLSTRPSNTRNDRSRPTSTFA
jgi:hypothetical protein